MNRVKVVKVEKYRLIFENGFILTSNHDRECCEVHYLDMIDLSINDFEGLEFDFTDEDFFERVDDYGIRLKPINGYPIPIPGYGENNGYYSDDLDLVLICEHGFKKIFNITNCQKIEEV